MTIMQKQTTTFIKKFEGDHEISLSCTTLPLGQLHDFLMEMKGWCVERMVLAQKEEIEHADILKKNEADDCLEGGCDGS